MSLWIPFGLEKCLEERARQGVIVRRGKTVAEAHFVFAALRFDSTGVYKHGNSVTLPRLGDRCVRSHFGSKFIGFNCGRGRRPLRFGTSGCIRLYSQALCVQSLRRCWKDDGKIERPRRCRQEASEGGIRQANFILEECEY